MNECRQAERLGAYHDGELSAEARAEVERHIGQCPACAAELRRLRKLSQLLGAAAPPKLSPAILARLHDGIDTIPLADLRRVAEVCGAIAASILLVCTIWLVTTRSGVDAIPVWETVAVARQEIPAVAPEEQLLTQWIVQDLSGKNTND
jgi:anti-sigma factor RsiW